MCPSPHNRSMPRGIGGGKPECHSLQIPHQHTTSTLQLRRPTSTCSSYTSRYWLLPFSPFSRGVRRIVGLSVSTCRVLLLCATWQYDVSIGVLAEVDSTAVVTAVCVVFAAIHIRTLLRRECVKRIHKAISDRLLSWTSTSTHVLTASYFVAALTGDTYEQAPRVNVSLCRPADHARIRPPSLRTC